MTYRRWTIKIISGLGALGLLLTIALPVSALDAYQDRRGLFWGMGLGGGGIFAVPSGQAGGSVLLDFQLGGGATRNLTLCFDTDFRVQMLEDFTILSIAPGPELNYFFGDTGFFVRIGLAMAMDIGLRDDSDFKIGFDSSLGGGWEFFVNSNLTLGLALEGNYVLKENDDLVGIWFVFSLRYY